MEFVLDKLNLYCCAIDKFELISVQETPLSIDLKIPPGTHPGQLLSIKGYGIPDVRSRQRGNAFVQIDADIPRITDPKIAEELKRITKGF